MPKRAADLQRVPPADLPAVDPDALGERVEHALDREVRLVDPEAAHRPGGRVVRVDGRRLDVDVRHRVGAAGVAGGALEHLVADAGVGAGVADDACAHARRGAPRRRSRGCSRATSDDASSGSAGSPAGEREQHGPPRRQCEQSRVRLDVQVLLRAECAARRDLRHPHLFLGQAEERRDLPPVLPDSLALGVDLERSVVLRDDEAPTRARGTRARCTACGRSPRRRAPRPRARRRRRRAARARPRARCRSREPRRARVQRLERVGDRVEHLVLHLDERRRLARRVARLGGDGGEHVADVRRGLALGDELSPVAW